MFPKFFPKNRAPIGLAWARMQIIVRSARSTHVDHYWRRCRTTWVAQNHSMAEIALRQVLSSSYIHRAEESKNQLGGAGPMDITVKDNEQ